MREGDRTVSDEEILAFCRAMVLAGKSTDRDAEYAVDLLRGIPGRPMFLLYGWGGGLRLSGSVLSLSMCSLCNMPYLMKMLERMVELEIYSVIDSIQRVSPEEALHIAAVSINGNRSGYGYSFEHSGIERGVFG
jgi:hypothetical protein